MTEGQKESHGGHKTTTLPQQNTSAEIDKTLKYARPFGFLWYYPMLHHFARPAVLALFGASNTINTPPDGQN